MSVESLLLIRCKESIEELNSVVSSQKQEIERLERHGRKLVIEVEQKESSRLAMLEEVSRLRRQLVEEKMKHDNQLNQERLQVVTLKKSLDDAEVAHHNLLAHTVNLQQQVKMLSQRLQQNQKISREWEESIVEVNSKIRLNELERKQLNEDLKKERQAANKQVQLYKLQVAELKSQCERFNTRNLELEVILQGKNGEIDKYSRQHIDIARLGNEMKLQQQTLRVLESQNHKFLDIIQQQKLTMIRQEEEIDLLSRKLIHLRPDQNPPKPLSVIKNNGNSAYQSNRSEFQLERQPKRPRRSSKHTNIEQYPSQPVSQPQSVATNSIKKKLEFEQEPPTKSRRSTSKSRLEKLGRLETRIKNIMESLRS